MATTMSTLLRAARKASAAASRAAAAAVSRAAAAAALSLRSSGRVPASAVSRAARRFGSGFNMWPIRGEASMFASPVDFEDLLDDATIPRDEDFESDEALLSLYQRWCKAFDKERDHAELDHRRFKLFRYSAEYVHKWNSFVPEDKYEAAIFLSKRREAEVLLSRGEDISHIDECYLLMELGAFADGGDPYFNEHDMSLLKAIEERDVKASLGKSQTLDEMN